MNHDSSMWLFSYAYKFCIDHIFKQGSTIISKNNCFIFLYRQVLKDIIKRQIWVYVFESHDFIPKFHSFVSLYFNHVCLYFHQNFKFHYIFQWVRWRDANKRMIGICNLCLAKRSDSSKRMKSYGHKCQHRAPFKVSTLKANKQSQDGLMRQMRHLSPRTQSSHLTATRDGLRMSFRNLAKYSWTKTSTLLGHQ